MAFAIRDPTHQNLIGSGRRSIGTNIAGHANPDPAGVPFMIGAGLMALVQVGVVICRLLRA